MIPGLGLLRRTITLALCSSAFWAGMQVKEMSMISACRAADGLPNAVGVCTGVSK
jgi:hypothetical protein